VVAVSFFYFDGIHDHDTLLDMVRAEEAAG
jgi:hypothetical protein